MDYDLRSGSAYMQILCHVRSQMPIVPLHFLDKLCVCVSSVTCLLHNAMLGEMFTLLLRIKEHLSHHREPLEHLFISLTSQVN